MGVMAAGVESDIWGRVIKASEVGEMSGPIKTTWVGKKKEGLFL